MRNRIYSLATSWPFVCAVVVLLLNDWWLKSAHPGILSGKLSDFSGIAIVGLLAIAAWPHRTPQIYAVTSAGFIWWKSALSEPFIQLVNAYAPVAIGRTVDYTDLVALIVLPACSYIVAHCQAFALPWPTVRRVLFVPVIAATVFGTAATSTVPMHEDYGIRSTYCDEPCRDQVHEEIAAVAARHGLVCDACPLSDGSMVYRSKYLLMSYRFSSTATVAFSIEESPGGLPGASGRERVDALRSALKTVLAKRFEALQYAEPLTPHRESADACS